MIGAILWTFFERILYWAQGLIIGAIESLPEVEIPVIMQGFGDTFDLLAKPLYLFPMDFFLTIWRTGLFWMGLLTAWALVEWVYKKIPGVS